MKGLIYYVKYGENMNRVDALFVFFIRNGRGARIFVNKKFTKNSQFKLEIHILFIISRNKFMSKL